MPLLDTREGRDLIGALVADIVFHLLSYLAQTEREFTHWRQAEGIAAAPEQGHFWPTHIPIPEGLEALVEDWWNSYVTATDAGKLLRVSLSTFSRRAAE